MKDSGEITIWTFCRGLMLPQNILKDKRGSAQKEAHNESSPNEQDRLDAEDPHPSKPESPSLLTSTQNDLRDNLKDAVSSIPVEPMTPQTGPPKVIPPYALQ